MSKRQKEDLDHLLLGQPLTEVDNMHAAQTTISQASEKKLDIDNLGVFIDRWSNVFEGKAALAEIVQGKVLNELQARGIQDVTVRPVIGVTSYLFKSERRPYVVAQTHPGVTVAIYVSESGKDLYVSWRTHARSVFNRRVIEAMAYAAAFPLILGLCAIFLTIYNIRNTLIPNPPSNLIKGLEDFQIFLQASASVVGWVLQGLIIIFLFFFLTQILICTLFGFYFKGAFTYYFRTEPNVFDAEDVAALSTTVHQVLLHAVDSAGIDISEIPEKVIHTSRRSERI